MSMYGTSSTTGTTITTISRVSHVPVGAGAADITLALEVAYDLHAPAGRAPELATPAPTSLGTTRRTKARTRHHTRPASPDPTAPPSSHLPPFLAL